MRGATRCLLGLTLWALMLPAACRRGPDEDATQARLQGRLDEAFGDGLFSVEGFHRFGHQPFTVSGDERDRLLTYYRSELAFEKAYRLSKWDSPNVGSLIWAAGATPLGVEGVDPAGNEAGDRLTLRGALAWAHGEERWEPVEHEAMAATSKETPTGEVTRPDYLASLDDLPKLLKGLDPAARDREAAALTRALARVVLESERRVARERGLLTIAAGVPGGAYHTLGRALARVLSARGGESLAFTTDGSAENARLVHRGHASFGFCQSDVARHAHDADGRFEGRFPMSELRAVGALFPEAVQVVTLASSGIERLSDLKGRRAEIGPPGSGTRANAVALLLAAGVPLSALTAVGANPLPEAMEALERGEADAIFITGAWPLPALGMFSAETSIRLIPVDGDTRAALVSSDPAYVPLEIPGGTYGDMKAGVATVGVTALLLTHVDTPSEIVVRVLTVLFDETRTLTRDSVRAGLISRETARKGLSIPLHPAAEAFF